MDEKEIDQQPTEKTHRLLIVAGPENTPQAWMTEPEAH